MESNGLQGPESQAVSWQIASNSLQLANIREGWTSVSANSTDFVELLAPTLSDATVIPQILSVLLISQERFLMRLTGFSIAATHGVFRLLSSSRDLNGSEIVDQRQLPSIWKGGIVVFPDQYLRQISGWPVMESFFDFLTRCPDVVQSGVTYHIV